MLNIVTTAIVRPLRPASGPSLSLVDLRVNVIVNLPLERRPEGLQPARWQERESRFSVEQRAAIHRYLALVAVNGVGVPPPGAPPSGPPSLTSPAPFSAPSTSLAV